MKNFKVRCIRNENDGFTKGKVYKVRNGVIIDDDNYKASVNFENVEELNETFDSQFELVEKEPLKVGDYVVTKKNIKLNNNQLDFSNYMRVEEPLRVVRILYDKYIQLDNNFAYESKWLKKVEPPKEKKVFNIKEYDDKTVMHVDTQEKADKLCEYLKSIGIKQDRNKYWYIYGEDTCFEIFSDAYTNKEWYEKNGYTILEFDDFIFEKPKVEAEEYKGFKKEKRLYLNIPFDNSISEWCFSESEEITKWYIDNGRAFHTKAEAERKKECMEILNKYKHEFILEDWERNTIKYAIDIDFDGRTLITDSWKNLLNSSSSIWFKTRQDAEKVIDLIGYDDWCKYILNLR